MYDKYMTKRDEIKNFSFFQKKIAKKHDIFI